MYVERPHRSIYDKQYDDKREGAGARGYNSEWQKISRPLLNNLCSMCNQVKAQLVHHDPPYIQGTDHRQYNLIPMCYRCHKKLHSTLDRVRG
jgi:5-methylcytosine-specific restriction endonuclease McrA